MPVIERFRTILNLTTDRTVVNATFGLTSRLDLGVVVPFGRTSVKGTTIYSYEIIPLGLFPRYETRDHTAIGAGLGDITVKAKYLIVSRPRFSAGVAGDLRLPTGSQTKLLGTGRLAKKASALGALNLGRFAPHVEAGYLFAGPGLRFDRGFGNTLSLTSAVPSDELTYSAGVDVAVNRRLTVAVDALGRSLRHSAEIHRSSNFDGYEATPRSLSLLLGAAGVKVSVGASWLLTGSVLFPLNDEGLKPAVTPVMGFERAF